MEHKMKVYLVTLTGGGDTYRKIVDEETFNWICSDDPGQPEGTSEDAYSWIDQLVPASQLTKMKADDEDFAGVDLSSGSWENDRAIFAYPADGYLDDYFSTKEVMQAIKNHGDELEDEYEGYMY
jgi:hypothetical protein